MNSLRWLCLLPLLWAGIASSQTVESSKITAQGLSDQSQFSVRPTTNGVILQYTNGVVLVYTNAVLTADVIDVNEETQEAQASGGVTLQQGVNFWRSESLSYNFRTGQMQAREFRTGRVPYFASGESLSADVTNRIYTLHRALFTTDDVQAPAYFIRADEIKLIEGQRVQARKAVLYLGRVPVMFFPKFSRDLGKNPASWTFLPGYRSLYGPFLLSAYHWSWATNFQGVINMDFRLERGVGLGPEFGWDQGRWGRGGLNFYFMEDQDPGVDPAGNPIQSSRQRLSLTHQLNLRTNLTAKLLVREQSDAYFMRDFFESEFRGNPQPKSFLEINQLWSNWSLDFLVQPQLNDFYETVERLPDAKLSGIRQQLGESPFFYESESSFGYLRFQPDERTALTPYAAVRADTFHQVLLPKTFFGWLNVTPRVGGRFTHYGESEGPGTTLDERDRAVFNTGAEVSFKASRTWHGLSSKLWDLDGLRHIVEPSFNYVFVPEPGQVPRELPQFDSAIPMLRLLPVDFPDYNAIDSIDTQNVLRLGLRNKVQTKRDGQIDHLVNWEVFMDWRLNPRNNQHTLSDLYSRLDLRPRSWATFSSEFRYDTTRKQIRYSDTSLTLTPGQTWSWSLGHLYFREEPALGPDSGNNTFRSSLYYRMNENWGFRMTHHFEGRDGLMEEQYYTFYRDLRSWTSALSFRFRENRTGSDDFTVAVTFSLKAFPRFKQGKDRDHHSLLLGG